MSELRASFAERDVYLDLLAQHYADGRLDDAEFDLRRDAILAATTHRQMQAQFRDLPAIRRPEPDAAPTPPSSAPAPVPATPPAPGRHRRRAFLLGGAAAVGALVVGAVVHESLQNGPGAIPDRLPAETEDSMSFANSPGHAFSTAWAAVEPIGAHLVSSLTIQQGRVVGSALSDDGARGWAFAVSESGVESMRKAPVPAPVPPSADAGQVQMFLDSLPERAGEVFGGFADELAMDVELAFQGSQPVFSVRVRGESSGTASWDMDGNLLSLRKDQ